LFAAARWQALLATLSGVSRYLAAAIIFYEDAISEIVEIIERQQ